MSFIKNVDLHEHNKQVKKYVIDNTELFVFKNFLSDNDYDKLVKIIDTHLRYEQLDKDNVNVSSTITYGHSSIGWHPYYIPHWNFTLTYNDFFRVYIFEKIKTICEWTKDLQIKRIYCSCQSAEQIGNWHYDDNDINSFTFCLYCNLDRVRASSGLDKECNELYRNMFGKEAINRGNDDDDGYFHIKYDKEPIRIIKANSNSAVLFNSTIAHNGDSLKYDSISLRCVIAYKLVLP